MDAQILPSCRFPASEDVELSRNQNASYIQFPEGSWRFQDLLFLADRDLRQSFLMQRDFKSILSKGACCHSTNRSQIA